MNICLDNTTAILVLDCLIDKLSSLISKLEKDYIRFSDLEEFSKYHKIANAIISTYEFEESDMKEYKEVLISLNCTYEIAYRRFKSNELY